MRKSSEICQKYQKIQQNSKQCKTMPKIAKKHILYLKWNFDRGSFVVVVVFYVPTVQYCSTVQFCCTCAVNKYTRRTTGTRWDTHHGHYTGNSYTGTSRPCLNYPWDSRLIKGMHNEGLIYFGSSYKHCQHDLADH